MSLISNGDLQTWADDWALWAATAVGSAQVDSFNAGVAAANATILSADGGVTPGSLAAAILATDDEAVIADLLPSLRDLDETNPTAPTRFLFGITAVSAAINAMNTHLRHYTDGAYATLDAYLLHLNASTPTLRVHQAFADHLKSLSRKNVFIGSDTVLATFTVLSATTGTFASVATIGTSYAGAKLVVKNQGGNTSGATLTITGKKVDGTSNAALTVTVSSGTDNAEQDLSDTLQLYVEVTAIAITGGTATDVYEIVAKTDRSIS